eukprot:39813-Chlamydomonas_euryale.AAC.1
MRVRGGGTTRVTGGGTTRVTGGGTTRVRGGSTTREWNEETRGSSILETREGELPGRCNYDTRTLAVGLDTLARGH